MGCRTKRIRHLIRAQNNHKSPSFSRLCFGDGGDVYGRHLLRSSVTTSCGRVIDQSSGVGIVITSPQGEDLEFTIKFGFKASNNEAKYETLVIGMRMAHEAGARHLLAYSDSQLIVKQIEGAFEAKEEIRKILKPIACQSSLVLKRLQDKAHHYTIPPRSKSPLGYQPITTSVDWRTPIMRWIEEGHLPDDRWEAARLKARATRFLVQAGTLYKRSYTHPLLRCPPQEKEPISSKRYIAAVVELMLAHGLWPTKPYEQDTSGLP
ncbi:UNVERIFIED_CONTAM: hypothetical protein Slati_2169500 [Sesamum latifolium]|uniref:RNase H type-1 domain-containing protein n=1 Tax=Sesamum latifolium TaxID=2727402 RepID=A0AAW2WST8_9LAMI